MTDMSERIEPMRTEDSGPMLIVGIAAHYAYASMGPNEIPEQWRDFMPTVGTLVRPKAGVTYGVCVNTFDGNKSFLYMSGVEIDIPTDLPDAYSGMRFPAQRYLVFKHDANVTELHKTIDAIWNHWLPKSAFKPTHLPSYFERYGEHFDPNVGQGDVEVWVPIEHDTP